MSGVPGVPGVHVLAAERDPLGLTLTVETDQTTTPDDEKPADGASVMMAECGSSGTPTPAFASSSQTARY